MKNIDEVIKLLNEILENELAGIVKYNHYSLMIFGFNRIPIVSWFRSQATESMSHAQEAGELITHFGYHPSLNIGKLLETYNHDIGAILRESMEHEKAVLALYRKLFHMVKNENLMLEEYALKMIHTEELHCGEVNKMLRNPGDVEAFKD